MKTLEERRKEVKELIQIAMMIMAQINVKKITKDSSIT